MERKDIYYNVPKIEDALSRVEKSEINQISKKYIVEFDKENNRRNLNQKRRIKLIRQISYVAKVIESKFNKNLAEIDRELIEDFMCFVYENKEWRSYTKFDYFRIIKQFIKCHPQYDDIILKQHKSGKKRYEKFVFRAKLETKSEKEQIITEIEIKKVLSLCKNKRNKAFIALLHETGCRADEILNIRYKDIRHKGKLILIKVDGKTGERDIPVLSSKPYVTAYLNDFPNPDPSGIIWKVEGNFNKKKSGYDSIGYNAAVKIVDLAFIGTGLEQKKHNLHYFRHSRATLNAEFMMEAQMCKFFGWVIGSGQTATYVNKNTLDLENTLLRKHGFKEDNIQDTAMSLQTCPTCNYNDNMATAYYCQRCSSPLSLKIAYAEEKTLREETDKTIKLLMDIAKNPELMSKFEEFRKVVG